MPRFNFQKTMDYRTAAVMPSENGSWAEKEPLPTKDMRNFACCKCRELHPHPHVLTRHLRMRPQVLQTCQEGAMGPQLTQGLLFLFLLLGASSLTLAQNFYCHRGVSMSVKGDPSMFDWSTEKVEACDNGSLCQESVLIVKSGSKAAIVATKGCMPHQSPAITFVQHSPPPGVLVVSSSHYCELSNCNHRRNLPNVGTESLPVPSVSETLHCPTCVAFGTCLSAPYLPCPNDTNRCYHGKLRVAGGDIDSTLEVRGCTSVTGCRLMSGVFTIGPMHVKEICPFQTLIQPRKVENGANWLPISVGKLELLLLLLLQSPVHCS
ncbi:testis-expressed protein 101 [Artibeus jamaicensis]|uniref:testis-expressed protein 101 n=1 Tax=Artibeus jamaicensis TaxID=9417 RepID=UPI00235A5E59|nr:testis-expressed protein 101 [Artibeus jamaicensis]